MIHPQSRPPIRALRLARGLTQAQLAGDDFTKGFVSQLESGRTRLSLRAAQVLAGRLGVAVDDLIGTDTRVTTRDLDIVRAERELAAGDPGAALRLARGLPIEGGHRGRILRLQGRALLALDRASEALRPLDTALVEFRARAQRDLAVRTLYDIALAHARLDESDEGLVVGLECLRALEAGDLIDRTLELQVRTFLGATYVRRGDFALADAQMERAVELARDVTSFEAQAQLYAGLAQTAHDRGDPGQAEVFWSRSLEALEHLGREQAVAETWSNLALTRIEQGRLPEAREALANADELASRLNHVRLRAYLEVARAKIALADRRNVEAEAIADSVARDRNARPRARIEALLLIADSLAARKVPKQRVVTAYEAALAAAVNEPAGDRARILRQLADALEAANDTARALERMREALELLRPTRTRN